MLYLVAQTTQNIPDISSETKFIQYSIPLLITAIGILFYLLRDSYVARISDREAMAKQIVEIQLKNHELFTGLKISIDTSNDATNKLITVLSDLRTEDLKKKIRDMEDQSKKVVN